MDGDEPPDKVSIQSSEDTTLTTPVIGEPTTNADANPEDATRTETTKPVCTNTDCTKEAEHSMILCSKCKITTHFACTRLPAYQLSMFMTKRYRQYVCKTCYGEVHEDYTKDSYEKECESFEEELTAEIEGLEEKVESLNQRLEVNQGELHRVNDCLTIQKNNNIIINHNLNERNTDNAALNEKVRMLEEEAVKLKSRLKTQDQKLTDIVAEELKLQNRLRGQGDVIKNMKQKLKHTEKHTDGTLVLPSSNNDKLLLDNKEQEEMIQALKAEAEVYESSMKN